MRGSQKCWWSRWASRKTTSSPRHLARDLGAESIDFLDIVFRLEREFKIKIERNELFPDPISPDDPVFAGTAD